MDARSAPHEERNYSCTCHSPIQLITQSDARSPTLSPTGINRLSSNLYLSDSRREAERQRGPQLIAMAWERPGRFDARRA